MNDKWGQTYHNEDTNKQEHQVLVGEFLLTVVTDGELSSYSVDVAGYKGYERLVYRLFYEIKTIPELKELALKALKGYLAPAIADLNGLDPQTLSEFMRPDLANLILKEYKFDENTPVIYIGNIHANWEDGVIDAMAHGDLTNDKIPDKQFAALNGVEITFQLNGIQKQGKLGIGWKNDRSCIYILSMEEEDIDMESMLRKARG